MKIYFIAICGKGVGNLALFLKKQGNEVLGSEYSEKTFYPPIADLIEDAEIPVDFGFDPEKITSDIDLVVLGGAAFIHDPENPQVKKAKELGLKTISFARGIGEFIAKENAIEIVGNHGKTTTTSLIAWMIKEFGEDVSYFIGEAPLGFESSTYSGESKWSVCEGDEHPTLNVEEGGKFLYHNPKHIVFTSADWDHKNIYKTEESYYKAFKDLFDIQPKDGEIIACLDGIKVLDILESTKKLNKITFYTISDYKDSLKEVDSDVIESDIQKKVEKLKSNYPECFKRTEYLYYITEVDYKWQPDSTRFLLKKLDLKDMSSVKVGYFETPLLGEIGLENSLASLTTLVNFGFDSDLDKLKDGLDSFKGAKRRQELILNREYKVINDYAHSPIKIASSLKSIRTKFYDKKIFVIFHVTQSALKEKTTFNQLKSVFNLADFVLIPRVTPNMDASDQFFGKDYRDLIKEGAAESDDDFLKASNVYYTPLGVQMQSVLENNLCRDDVIVIMSTGDATELVELTKGLRISN